MSSIGCLFVSILAVATVCDAQRHPVHIAPNRESSVVYAAGGFTIKAIFNTSTIDGQSMGNSHQFVQCTNSRIPCSLTGHIQVTIGGKNVPLPRSAFADLGDVSDAELSRKNGHVILTIIGGDASESYIAKLSFHSGRLIERRLFAGEDFSRPVEISRYY